MRVRTGSFKSYGNFTIKTQKTGLKASICSETEESNSRVKLQNLREILASYFFLV